MNEQAPQPENVPIYMDVLTDFGFKKIFMNPKNNLHYIGSFDISLQRRWVQIPYWDDADGRRLGLCTRANNLGHALGHLIAT